MDTNRVEEKKEQPDRTPNNGRDNAASGDLDEALLNAHMASLLEHLPDIDVTDTTSVLSKSADEPSMQSSR